MIEAKLQSTQNMQNQRLVFSLIFIATAAIMVLVRNNFLALALFLCLWAAPLKFYRKNDLWFFIIGFLSFLFLDMIVVAKGVFSFARPDFLGLPVFEPFLWGFYLVTINKIGGSEEIFPRRNIFCILILLALLSSYLIFRNNLSIFLTQAAILAIVSLFWHKKSDISYTIIAVVMGAIVEYVNVACGNWFYPGGGVPVWFLTFWAAVGLLDNRFVRANFSYD